MIKVSICIPAYKQPELLKRCIRSVFEQTYRTFEIIVSDDTPDDSVKRAVEPFVNERGFKYFRNTPPLGTPGNWNEAMKKASGDHLMVLHHDDWLYAKDTLEKLATAAERTSADLVFAQSYNVSPDGSLRTKNAPGERELSKMVRSTRTLFYHNWIGAPSAVLIRNKGLSYDPRLKWLVDVDLYIRQIGPGGLAYVPDAVVGIGLSPEQATGSCYGNPDVEIPENIAVYRKIGTRWASLGHDLVHFHRIFSRLRSTIGQLLRYEPTLTVLIFYAMSWLWNALKRVFRALRSSESPG